MDYITGIQNAINYIENHLTEEIDLKRLANEACMSTFYFQRIFGILCGITLGEYIRYRRLSLAGSELSNTDAKVIDIALKYGYETPESFARAFLKFHGISPRSAKTKRQQLTYFSPVSVKITLHGGNRMNYKIVEKEAFTIIEKVSNHSMENSVNSKSIPDFWSRCHKDGTVRFLTDNAVDNTYIFGLCYGNTDKESKNFEYGIGALWDSEKNIPKEYRKTVIPARTWLVFECVGSMPKSMQELWHRITSEFFPTSNFIPTYEMDIEAYTVGNMDTVNYRSEIWIPVVSK